MVNKFVDQVFAQLVKGEISEQDRQEIEARLFDHFNQVLIDTIVDGLNDDELREFNILMSLPDEQQMQEGIARFVAKIPGVHLKIEDALQEEAESLVQGKKIIDR